MLQRIQSLYMLLAALFLGAALFIDKSAAVYFTWLPVPGWLSAGLLLVNIFLFGNRPLQMKINNLILLLILVWIGLRIYGAVTSGGFAPEKDVPVWVLALVSVVLVKLAQSAIKRDENLVKSVDRIR